MARVRSEDELAGCSASAQRGGGGAHAGSCQESESSTALLPRWKLSPGPKKRPWSARFPPAKPDRNAWGGRGYRHDNGDRLVARRRRRPCDGYVCSERRSGRDREGEEARGFPACSATIAYPGRGYGPCSAGYSSCVPRTTPSRDALSRWIHSSCSKTLRLRSAGTASLQCFSTRPHETNGDHSSGSAQLPGVYTS